MRDSGLMQSTAVSMTADMQPRLLLTYAVSKASFSLREQTLNRAVPQGGVRRRDVHTETVGTSTYRGYTRDDVSFARATLSILVSMSIDI